jgi:tRNA modification GTPase
MSIALDRPGTTRDYTAGLIELAGLVVRWHDTPGLRSARDAIERDSIDIAGRLIERADCLIAMTDAAHDWPRLPRPPDLRLAARADLGARADADLALSARSGAGLGDLTAAIRELLVPGDDLGHPGPWRFDRRLRPRSDA